MSGRRPEKRGSEVGGQLCEPGTHVVVNRGRWLEKLAGTGDLGRPMPPHSSNAGCSVVRGLTIESVRTERNRTEDSGGVAVKN